MPMDLSAVQQLCTEAAPVMRDILWCNATTINLHYGPCDNKNHMAQCVRNVPYRRAEITLDPAKHDTEDDVLESLRHELVHVQLEEFDVFWRVVTAGMDDEDPLLARYHEVWTLAVERTVNRIECMLDDLRWTARAMAGLDTTCSGCGHTWRAAAPEGTETVDCPQCGDHVTHGRKSP